LSSIIFRTIRDRRSVRKYRLKEVSNSVLQRVLDAARWAPSAHNAQPWRFIVVKHPNVKRRLAEAMAGEWNKDLRKDGILSEDRERFIKASIRQFTDPPILIVACLTMDDMDKYPDKERQEAEYVMAVQSVAAAIQNMLLTAHAEGLGACWFCAPLFCPGVVRKTLGIPKDIRPQALITLGYPAGRPKAPPRKPIESIVYQNHWGRGR
jgi:F420 biosynthesis protein FbiB-like protein